MKGALFTLVIPMVGCSFDRTSLEERRACETEQDCPEGQICSLGTCLSSVDRDVTDSGVGDIDRFDTNRDSGDMSTEDTSVPDLIAEDTGTDINADVVETDSEVGEDVAEGDSDTREEDEQPADLSEDVASDPDAADTSDGEDLAEAGDTADEFEVHDILEEPDEDDLFDEPDVTDTTETLDEPDQLNCFPFDENVCGGCDLLVFSPGDWCGSCGVYECEEDDDGLTGKLSCAEPTETGEECGECGGGEWVCELLDSELTCSDPDPVNDCGGCDELKDERYDNCSCSEDGSATWDCDGEDDLVCTQDDDDIDHATSMGTGNDEGHDDATGVLDYEGDVDWFVRVADEDIPGGGGGKTIEPKVRLRSEEGGEVPYLVCVFYSYDDERGRNLGDYSCGGANSCGWWDQSTDEVQQWDADTCNGREGFDATADLYGCCETTYVEEGRNRGITARLGDIDGDGDDRGTAWIRVADQGNEDSCDLYQLEVGF